MLRPVQVLVGAENELTGRYTESSIGLVTVSEQPILSVIISRILYVLVNEYMWLMAGEKTVDRLPSPKDHLYLLMVAPGASVLLSVKVAVSGRQPPVGVTEKLPVGFATST